MGEPAKQTQKPPADEETTRIAFLDADLELCFTFARLVETEIQIKDKKGAEGALDKAEKGYATVQKFMPRVSDPKQRKELQAKSDRLRETLDELQRKVELAEASRSRIDQRS